jgi:GT2 family glycosyltransferase
MKVLKEFFSPGFGAPWLRWFKPIIGQWRLRLGRDNQLEKQDANDEFNWLATGSDPKFAVVGSIPLPGWHMLEVMLDHNQAGAKVKLYWAGRQGFSEDCSASLSLKRGRITKRLIYIPFVTKAIRFDPMESAGRFSVGHFRLGWVTPWFAQDRLLQRLINMHHRWREQSKAEVMKSLRLESRKQGCSWRSFALKVYDETFTQVRASKDYRSWLLDREDLNLDAVGSDIGEFEYCPLISIVLPVYNPNPDWLRECLESVLDQSYSNWQLCIVDDASSDPQVGALLREYKLQDERIQLSFRKENGHISAASNTALQMASGEYLALLDHDDRLETHALFRVVEAINHNPDVAILYSDEDKLNEEGQRYDPHFKARWNPDLLLSHNYMSHLGVYSTDLVREVGGFREGFEGSQDYDLVLRCCARVEPRQIVHIPDILYHWRAGKGSTALESGQKDYTGDAGLRALRDYLEGQVEAAAKAELGPVPNSYRVTWALPELVPLVSLVIPTRDSIDILKPCVQSILEHTRYSNFEVLIVDNESTCPETLDYLAQVGQDHRVSILEWHKPFNYSAINNFAVSHASGEIVGLVNNDIEPINNDWLEEMVRQAYREVIGCVGAKLYYPNDTIQHAGVILGIGGVAGHSHKYSSRNEHGYFSRLRLVQNLSAVTGACMMLRRSVFDEVGGLDENLAVAFNDVDFCLRVREAGYRNLWTPYAELYHHESKTRGENNTREKQERARKEAEYMRKKWGKALDQDPAYNPNLTLIHEDFSLK